MKIDVRFLRATEDDIYDIYDNVRSVIDRFTLPYGFDRESCYREAYKRIKDNISQYTMVSTKGHKIGHFCFHEVNHQLWIDDMYVYDQFQNRGVGKQILRFCTSQTEDDIFVRVFELNYMTGRFFIKNKFYPVELHEMVYTHRFRTPWR